MTDFSNSDYDEPQKMQIIADDSKLFKTLLTGLVRDTDQDYPTNAAWLGTLNINGKTAQVKLSVTQDPEKFIDED